MGVLPGEVSGFLMGGKVDGFYVYFLVYFIAGLMGGSVDGY